MAAAIISLSVGYSQNGFDAVIAVLTGSASSSTKLIITTIRLPRIIACILGGASLEIGRAHV